jgi:hypothetical protein
MGKLAFVGASIVGAVALLCCTGGGSDSSSGFSSSGSTTSSSGGSSGASSGGSSGSSGASSTSGASGSSGDPCAGLGCAGPQGSIYVKVVDGEGKPIAAPVFTLNNAATGAQCTVTTDAGTDYETPDAGAPCPGEWLINVYQFGTPITVGVSAPSHQANTVSVTLARPGGCCGGNVSAHQTVTLTP